MNQSLSRAFCHPLRVRAFEELRRRPASRAELAISLGAELGRVGYHVDVLAGLGLLRPAVAPGPGGERRYEAIAVPLVAAEGAASAPPPPAPVRRAVEACREGLREGLAGRGEESDLARLHGLLDGRDWQAAGAILALTEGALWRAGGSELPPDADEIALGSR